MVFELLHLDEHLAVVVKPAGIHVHPTALSPREPAMLQPLRDQLGGFVHPAHRLDRPTAGVMVFARTPEAASALGRDFAAGRVEKTYHALARGWFPDRLTADSPIAGERGSEERPALTDFRLLERFELPWPLGKHSTVRLSLVEAVPHTGRRHQIRRHLARSTHPIIGDTSWGCRHHNHLFAERLPPGGLQLFAVELGFRHPFSGEWLRFTWLPAGEAARVLDAVREASAPV